MNIIYYWPDGYWCYAGEIGEHQHRSDDYGRLTVPDSCFDYDIDILVREEIK